MAQTESFEAIPETSKEIKENLAKGMGYSQRDIDDDNLSFFISDQSESLDIVSLLVNGLKGIVIAIGAIALVVGSIGIMNIMLVTVTERTKEIGTMKALGFNKRNIHTLFLVESVMISLIGGVIGIILGILMAYFASSYMNISFSVPVGAVFAAFSVSVIIGIVSGSYPAKKAAEMDPVEALRRE